jgi:hypothetical protein
MEQQLINAFMKFTAKMGAGEMIKDLIREVDENGNPKAWTPAEIEKGIAYLNHLTESFDKTQARTIATTLIKKFDLDMTQLHSGAEIMPETNGVQGLQ